MPTQLPLVAQGVETVLQPPVNASELSSTQAAPLFVHVSETTFVPANVCNPPNTNAGGDDGAGTSTETFPNEEDPKETSSGP